jgi:hypothetical protein
MDARRALTTVGLVLAASSASCTGGGYDVVVRFEPPALVDQVVRVELALVPNCAGQPPGEPASGAAAMVDVRRMESSSPIGDAPPGTYGLYARGLAEDCRVAVSGCTDVVIEGGGSGTLIVTLTAIDGDRCPDGMYCSGGECMVGAGPDASMDAPDAPDACGDCNDDDPCTDDVCGAMGCENPPAADGTACTNGLCYEGACCAGCWDGAACQTGDVGGACGVAGAMCTTCMDTDDCTDDGCDDSGACAFTTRDADGDGHGDPVCAEAGGVPADDCDETDPAIYPMADERCNGIDDDCDGDIDEVTICAPGTMQACVTTCGSAGMQSCTDLCVWEPCVPPAETCNADDDDCDGDVDEDFDCAASGSGTCTTSCGSTGSRTCRSDCTWRACTAPAETCNGMDDDCDGSSDEDFTCRRGATRSCDSCGTAGTDTCNSSCNWSGCAMSATAGDIALWTFDDEPTTRTITDSIGSHDGAFMSGDAIWTSGPWGCGDAMQLPASGSPYGEIPDSSDWDLAEGRIDLWAILVDDGREMGIIGRDANGTTLPGHLKLIHTAAGVLRMRLQTAAGEAERCGPASQVPTGEWVHVSMRFGTTDPELVLNGVPLSGACTTGSTNQGIAGNANPWVIGADPGISLEGAALPLEDFWNNGVIDHILIRDRRASASNPEVTGFVLVNALADANLGPLAQGAVIDLGTVGTSLNIRANTDPGTVGSVVFDLDGVSGYATETGAPYALEGNTGSDYNTWTPTVGTHTLTATAYTGADGSGTAGTSQTITFEVR